MATSEPSQELNLPHLLEVLNRNNVEYILVGSMAAVIQGAPYATYDVDMIVKHSDQNLDRTAVALQELGARQIAGLQALEEGPPPTSGADLARHLSMFNTNAGRVDVLRQGVVIGRYEDIGPRALGYVIDGQTVLSPIFSQSSPTKRPAASLRTALSYTTSIDWPMSWGCHLPRSNAECLPANSTSSTSPLSDRK